MKIEKKYGLLITSMTILFRGNSKTVHDLVIDTGAAHSIIALNEVDDIGIVGELGDEIVFMHGIGGTEQALRKRIDQVEFNGLELENIQLDFWDFSSHGGMNGLIGLDILEAGEFVIDLKAMDLFQAGTHT